REAYHPRWNSLLMPVKLANFHFGSELRIFRRHSAQGDVFSQDRGASPAGNHAHLSSSDMDAITVPARLVPFQLNSYQDSLWMFLARDKSSLAGEIFFLGLKINRKTDARLKRVDLVIEFKTRKNQSCFDAEYIQCFKPKRSEVVRSSGFPHRI